VLPEDAAVEMGDAGSGVPIAEAIPGFCGYRSLQRGDVVLGVDAPQWTRTPTSNELVTAVSQSAAGRQVTLHVLRQGRMIEVPLVLSARPRVAEDIASTKQFFELRERRANEYWLAAFAPLMGREMS